MARIELRGKYAVGDHRFALVDDVDFARLNRWAWKAKWNGGRNNIYVIRVERIEGKSVDIRMHREVLGLQRGDSREVDHRDHFGLNNHRSNLRVATRSENILNARRRIVLVSCLHCGESSRRDVSATVAGQVVYCSEDCNKKAQAHKVSCAVSFPFCRGCNRQFTARQADSFWCGNACRKRAARPAHPSLRQRVLLALDEPRSPREVAHHAAAHESNVRKLLPELKAAGLVRLVAVERHAHGRPTNVYVRSSMFIA